MLQSERIEFPCNCGERHSYPTRRIVFNVPFRSSCGRWVLIPASCLHSTETEPCIYQPEQKPAVVVLRIWTAAALRYKSEPLRRAA
jgi:hypothetical protein